MAVKYTCPKCSRRFADWGAEKMGFKCPHDENCPPGTEDEDITLVRFGSTGTTPAATKPSLKRKKVAASPVAQEADILDDAESLVVVDDLEEELDDTEEETDDEEPEVLVKSSKITKSTDDVVVDDDEVVDEEEPLDFEADVASDADVDFVELDETT